MLGPPPMEPEVRPKLSVKELTKKDLEGKKVLVAKLLSEMSVF